MMIDLHSHTFFSDGCLIPSELARRAEVKGVSVLAITDHVDFSNYDFVLERVLKLTKSMNQHKGIRLIAGAEITHVPPEHIAELTTLLRKAGAEIVAVHGETITEPVAPGTNRAAIDAGVDFLAHPGIISEEDVKSAVKNGVSLEITSRKGHSITNGHVAKLSLYYGAKMIINTDSHAPGDLINKEEARKVLIGAGLIAEEIEATFRNSEELAERALKHSL